MARSEVLSMPCSAKHFIAVSRICSGLVADDGTALGWGSEPSIVTVLAEDT